jgi:hypothetical protein
MTISLTQRLRYVVEGILKYHTAAAVDELVAMFEDEIEERVQDRVHDLRTQLEQGGTE